MLLNWREIELQMARQGLNQKRLSVLSGIHQPWLSNLKKRIIAGDEVAPEHAAKIAAGLRVSVDLLILPEPVHQTLSTGEGI